MIFPPFLHQLPSFSKSRKPWQTFLGPLPSKICASAFLVTRTKVGYCQPQKCWTKLHRLAWLSHLNKCGERLVFLCELALRWSTDLMHHSLFCLSAIFSTFSLTLFSPAIPLRVDSCEGICCPMLRSDYFLHLVYNSHCAGKRLIFSKEYDHYWLIRTTSLYGKPLRLPLMLPHISRPCMRTTVTPICSNFGCYKFAIGELLGITGPCKGNQLYTEFEVVRVNIGNSECLRVASISAGLRSTIR